MKRGKAGFSGTRNPLPQIQANALWEQFVTLKPFTGHHGVCVGADEVFHGLCITYRVPVILHPPINQKLMAVCYGWTEIRKAKDYHERNHDIVDETDFLIATPNTLHPDPHSGTWSTIRYALRQHKPVIVVYPDGTVGEYIDETDVDW